MCLRLISQLLPPFADNASAVRPGEAGIGAAGHQQSSFASTGTAEGGRPYSFAAKRPRSVAAKQRSAEFHLLQLPVYFIADSDDYDHKNARHIIKFRSINLWQHAI